MSVKSALVTYSKLSSQLRNESFHIKVSRLILWMPLNVTTSGQTLFGPNKRLVLLTDGFI